MNLRRFTPWLMTVVFLTTLVALALRASTAVRAVAPAAQSTSAGQPSALAGTGLTGLLPPGALLTIESPDFAGLLHAWSGSVESTAWLHSANYSVFANSRLFGRLSAAQDEFASTAKLSTAGTSLLQQVAGGQSVFAWYDIGELQFLYITRMPAGRAQQSALFGQRASFERRQVGASAFYVRSESVPGSTRRRTVAFATVGDLLLLSTREDLMAGALTRIGKPGGNSVAADPWFLEATAGQPMEPVAPELRMVLNLERIVPTPYFRTYWIQQNISEFRQYRSAVSDLYRDRTAAGPRFREERTLLPAPSSIAPTSPDREQDQDRGGMQDPDLGSLAALVPPGTGVYRAKATSDPVDAVALLDEKLLTRIPAASSRSLSAPDPDLEATPAGDASDLETRIDTPALLPLSASTAALAQVLAAVGLEATLTIDTASTSPGLWTPIHSAVVFRTGRPLPPPALRDALQQALRGTLTASTLGIELRPSAANPAILQLSGPKPLFVAQAATPAGALTLLTDDLPTLTALLTRTGQPALPLAASFLAGFDHTTQHAPFLRLTSLIDTPASTSTAAVSEADAGSPSIAGEAPPFFSGNMRSLSDAFGRLASQQVLVRHQGANLHQTVTYQWRP